jgi:hypothetical protein
MSSNGRAEIVGGAAVFLPVPDGARRGSRLVGPIFLKEVIQSVSEVSHHEGRARALV